VAGNVTAGGNQTLTGSLTVDSTTDSTSATTGSIQTDGGVGIAKALFVGTTVTINGGTANGVAFLNGSKVLTTGSALVFDGSTLGVLTANAQPVSISSSNASATLVQHTNSNASADLFYRFRQNGGAGNFYDLTMEGSTNAFTIDYNDNERLRITSAGNVGIGTSSPSGILHLNSSSTNAVVQFVTNTGGEARIGVENSAGTGILSGAGAYDTAIRTATGTGISFGIGYSAPAMRLDSSGNLGLGVTPSAWGSGFKALQIQKGSFASFLSGSNIQTGVFSNVFFDNAYRYIDSQVATYYNQNNGSHQWFNAPSGTAGNAISFTQAMTLDASGNLAIGTSTPNSYGSTTTFTINGTTYSELDFEVGGTLQAYLAGVSGGFEISADGSRFIALRTNNTERMRIDSAGNVGIGTSSPGTTLDVRGRVTSQADNAYYRIRRASAADVGYVTDSGTWGDSGTDFAIGASSSNLRFYTNNSATERARIDSSGNLLVGTTSPITGATKLTVSGSHDDWMAGVKNTNASPRGLLIIHDTDSNGTANWFLYCEAASTQRMSVRSNGGIANFSANDSNLSDRREKTNFAPAGEYLSKICAIPVQTFNYIDQNHEEDPGLTLGVVAQDVQEVAPELVMESNWGTEDSPKMRLSIYQTDLQYALMKCIQEQQAIINDLKARLDAANL
jgi:hypothetical protein